MKTHPKEGIVPTREVTMWPAASTRWSAAEGWLRRAIHDAPATNRTWRGHERAQRVLKAHGVQLEYFRGGVHVGQRWRRAPSFSSLSLLSSLLAVMTNVLLGWWGGSRGYRLYSHGGISGREQRIPRIPYGVCCASSEDPNGVAEIAPRFVVFTRRGWSCQGDPTSNGTAAWGRRALSEGLRRGTHASVMWIGARGWKGDK
jgi:hypothetical protein